MGQHSQSSDARAHARRRVLAAALAAGVLVVGIGTNAFGAPSKPAPGPAPSSTGAPKAPAGSHAKAGRSAAAAAAAVAASPTSVHAAGTASGSPAGAQAAGAPSTDPALHPVDLGSLGQPALVLPVLRSEAASKGSVRVIVTLDTTFSALGALPAAAATAQRSSVRALSDTASATAVANGGTVTHTYDGNIPAVAITATPATLDALAASPAVAQINPDNEWAAPNLVDTTPLIGAADAQDRGFHGANTVVAIMDTGVDYSHPFFGGRVSNAACFSTGSDCPNGATSQFGGNAGIPCTFASGCFHGTHVAGIAAGAANGVNQFDGVANQARIEAIRIFHLGTCTGGVACPLASDSDILAGLNLAYSDRGIGTASVNMSLGGGSFTSNCDATYATIKTAIDNLRSVNIATVISSGNDGSTNAVSFPGCISTATTVGATDKSDVVAGFSNSSAQVDLYAPGVDVTSSVPGGGYGSASGTSMAAPQVTGAIAVMQARTPGLSVSSEESFLSSTGKSVTDAKSSLTRSRINVLRAIFQEVEVLANDVVIDHRNPIPNDHRYQSLTTNPYWSAVAIRPPAGGDFDLSVYDFFDYTGALASSAYGSDTIDFVAQDSNRRALDYTFPSVHRFGGTGRYQIEYANDVLTMGDGVNAIGMTSPEIVEIRDSYETAGIPTYYRVVPSNGSQDAEIFLMQSTAGVPSSYVQGRAGAAASSSATGAGGEESFVHTAPASQYNGFVLINRAGTGTYTVYRDTTAPAGSMVINTGDPATVNTRKVTLQIAASDAESGVRDMRVAVDGTADTEPWVPFAATPTVNLSAGAGLKTVQVQVRDNANAVATFTDTITLDTRPNYKVTAVSNPPATATRGTSFSVTDTTKNSGLTAGVASTNRYYLSTNTTYDAGTDVQLTGTRSLPALSNGVSNSGSTTVTIPATAGKTSYYVLTCADATNAVNEYSETDNCKASAAKVNVQLADYTVTSVSNPPATKARGTTFSATDTTKNTGNLAATVSSRTRFYLSVDAVRNGGDKALSPVRTVAALAAAATNSGSVTVTIPATGLAPGTYRLLACSDDLNVISESSETNNCKAAAASINVT